MSSYFVMSRRFNKRSAADFGLSDLGDDMAVRRMRRFFVAKWRCCMISAWGRRTRYYRVPLPDFPQLMDIVLRSNDEEDAFGAAAMIERQYPELLLEGEREAMMEIPRGGGLGKSGPASFACTT